MIVSAKFARENTTWSRSNKIRPVSWVMLLGRSFCCRSARVCAVGYRALHYVSAGRARLVAMDVHRYHKGPAASPSANIAPSTSALQEDSAELGLLKSLNQLRSVRLALVALKRFYLNRVWGMDLHPTCQFSLSARFDRTYPRGIHVGEESYVAFDAAILSHEMIRRLYAHTRIGRR